MIKPIIPIKITLHPQCMLGEVIICKSPTCDTETVYCVKGYDEPVRMVWTFNNINKPVELIYIPDDEV